MSQFYVQLDDRRFVAKMARKLASTDDPKQWTSINLPTAKDIDFGVNFDKYQVDESGTVIKGGDDAVTLGDVNTELATSLDTIKQQNDQINTLVNTTKDLQTVSGKLGTPSLVMQGLPVVLSIGAMSKVFCPPISSVPVL